MFLASAISGGNDADWYTGLGIGFAVVVVVVVVVAAILTFAQRILEEARRAVSGLEQASIATNAIWAMTEVNRSAKESREALARARQTLEGRSN